MTEKKAVKVNGFLGIIMNLVIYLLGTYFLVNMIMKEQFSAGSLIVAIIFILVGLVISSGFIIVQPNQAKALVFLGRYVGSIRESGFWLSVPFCERRSVSLKVRNF